MTMIHDTTIGSLSEYVELKQARLEEEWQQGDRKHQLLVPARPRQCAQCGNVDGFWVHSYYYRWAIEGALEEIVAVPRYECSFCTELVSVLFAFMVPYRQFTNRAIAAAVEMYLTVVCSYRIVAGLSSSEHFRPAHSQVWQWTELFASKVQAFLGLELQRICVESEKSEAELIEAGQRVCPNAECARRPGKPFKLNCAARAIGLAQLLLKRNGVLIEVLQTHFVQSVQSPFSIFTGRGIRLLAPQSSKHAF